jgi:hypothetical protein
LKADEHFGLGISSILNFVQRASLASLSTIAKKKKKKEKRFSGIFGASKDNLYCSDMKIIQEARGSVISLPE